MSTPDLLWIALFSVATFVFFVVAATIIFFGVRDLKDLLTGSDKRKKQLQ